MNSDSLDSRIKVARDVPSNISKPTQKGLEEGAWRNACFFLLGLKRGQIRVSRFEVQDWSFTPPSVGIALAD